MDSPVASGAGKHSWLALRASWVRYACILAELCSRTPRMMWCKPPTLANITAFAE